MRIFSNGGTREISEDTIISTDILKKRSGLLNDFLEKKKKLSDSDFPQLIRTIAMGTERILSDMNEIIDSMEHLDISETERNTHPVATHLIDNSRHRTVSLFREAISEISLVHSGLKQDDTMNYIERYSELHNKIQILSGQMIAEHSTLLSDLQTKAPTFSLESKTLLFMRKSQKVMKNTLVKIGAIMSVSFLALNLTATNANENSMEIKQSVSGQVNYIIKASGDNPDGTLASIEKKFSSNRALFSMLDTHPEKITSLAKFEERMKELKNRMIHDPFFASNTYKTGDWTSWNREVLKVLIPTVQDITPEETSIVIKALQMHLKIHTPDAKFGVLSKRALSKFIGSKQKSVVQEQVSETGAVYPMNIESSIVLKEIIREDFEEMTEKGNPEVSASLELPPILLSSLKSVSDVPRQSSRIKGKITKKEKGIPVCSYAARMNAKKVSGLQVPQGNPLVIKNLYERFSKGDKSMFVAHGWDHPTVIIEEFTYESLSKIRGVVDIVIHTGRRYLVKGKKIKFDHRIISFSSSTGAVYIMDSALSHDKVYRDTYQEGPVPLQEYLTILEEKRLKGKKYTMLIGAVYENKRSIIVDNGNPPNGLKLVYNAE